MGLAHQSAAQTEGEGAVPAPRGSVSQLETGVRF